MLELIGYIFLLNIPGFACALFSWIYWEVKNDKFNKETQQWIQKHIDMQDAQIVSQDKRIDDIHQFYRRQQ